MYLLGSALVTVDVSDGKVGLAWLAGETMTAASVRTVGTNASVWIGSGVTLTTSSTIRGEIEQYCASTNATVYGGSLTTEGTGTITTATVKAGTFVPNSSGTITTCNCNGGTTDTTQSGVARTITNLKINPGATFRRDPAVLTVTTHVAPDFPVNLSASSV